MLAQTDRAPNVLCSGTVWGVTRLGRNTSNSLASSRLTTAESTLPRYFFHTQSDFRFSDSEGLELAGLFEARKQAIQSCGELMKDCADVFWGSRPWTVTVTDAVGLVLWEIGIDGTAAPAAPA